MRLIEAIDGPKVKVNILISIAELGINESEYIEKVDFI